MASADTNSASESASAAGAPRPVIHSLNSQVRTLLLECTSRRDLMRRVLRLCADQFATSVERFDLRNHDQMEAQLSHHEAMERSLAERFNSELLAPMIQEVLASTDPQPRLKQFRRGDQDITLISVPVMDVQGDRTEGAITLLIGGKPRPEIVLPRLDGIAAVVSTALAVVTTSHRQAADDSSPSQHSTTNNTSPHPAAPESAMPSAGTSDQATPDATLVGQPATTNALVGVTATAAQFTSTQQFGYSVVNQLCEQITAELVAFGVESHRRIQVEAVSGVADFKPGNPGIAIVCQAMEECLDAAEIVVHQQPPLADIGSMPLHQSWSAATSNACVCSIPMIHDERVTSVVSIRRSANQPFTPEDINKLRQSLSRYGAAVELLASARRSPGQVLKSSATAVVRSTLGTGTTGRKVALGLAIVSLAWFLFGTMTYRPLCTATVVSADMRHVSVPVEGQLLAVHVQPGQQVEQGDLLLEFDTTDLQLELNKLVRDIAAADVKLREAISNDDISTAAVARGRVNVLKTQATALSKRIQDSTVIASVTGTVVLSGLPQRIGQTLPLGEDVLQLAAGNTWRLEIQVPDDIVHYVAAEQTGTFAADSLPTESQDFAISSIDGAATVQQNRNVFVAQAALHGHPSWMRSGMTGTARITSVPRPVWWVALHRVVDWARTSFWI